ncbi:MAG: efflux RND transporter periplasmic adaptor subunit [Nitrospiria bacterium]
MRKWWLIVVFTIAFVTALIIVMGVRIYKSLGSPNPVLAVENSTPARIPETRDKKESPDQSFGSVQAPPGGFDPKYVRSAPVSKGLAPDFIPIAGKLAFNAERTHTASARVAGRLNKVLVFEGNPVEKGQALAELYSPDYISAENEYLLARNTLRTIKEMENPELTKDSQATVKSARNKLRILGASDDDINEVEQMGVASTYFLIRAPISGIVIKRNMDAGAFLNVGDGFESISDTGKLWFLGNIYEQDYAKIKLGQNLRLQSEALPGRHFAGRLSYIFPSIDPTTHTLSIRCEIPNTAGELRPEIFVTASLFVGEIPVVIVPKTAVIHIKNTNYVIVDHGGGLYQRIQIKSVSFKENQAAVLSGLTGKENVVIEGATLINEMIGEI